MPAQIYNRATPPWLDTNSQSCCSSNVKSWCQTSSKVKRFAIDMLKSVPFFLFCFFTPTLVSLSFVAVVMILDCAKNEWFLKGNKAKYVMYGCGTSDICDSIVTLSKITQRTSLPFMLILSSIQLISGVWWFYRVYQLKKC